MDQTKSRIRRGFGRRPAGPALETLEARLVFNASGSTIHLAPAAFPRDRITILREHIEKSKAPVLGTLSRQGASSTSGKALKNVSVQLIDSSGAVVQTVKTNKKGQYNFKISQNGAYVVREITPKGMVQVTPSFANVPPVGALSPGFTAASWNYKSGNDQ